MSPQVPKYTQELLVSNAPAVSRTSIASRASSTNDGARIRKIISSAAETSSPTSTNLARDPQSLGDGSDGGCDGGGSVFMATRDASLGPEVVATTHEESMR